MAALAPLDVCGDGGVLVRLEKSAPSDLEPASDGDSVTIAYTGTLASSGAVFDENRAGFSFGVGSGTVIGGLDAAVRHLRAGSAADVTLRHDYAYGEQGLMGRIPPCAELRFSLEVLAIDRGAAASLGGGGGGSGGPTQMLALPAPEAVTEMGPSGEVPTLTVGGAPFKMDALGPIVVNSDGSTSRIANWHDMTPAEQEKTTRLIARRNKKRMEGEGAESGT